MIRRLLLLLLVPALVAAEDIAIPDRDIIAAYPLIDPIGKLGETEEIEDQIPHCSLIQRDNKLFKIDLLPEHHRRLSEIEPTWIIYDKTAHRLIARASARYHYLLGGLIRKEPQPIILRQDCAVYEVPTEQAKALTATPFPDLSHLPPPVLATSSQTRNAEINVVEKRQANGSLHVEWDSGYAEGQMAMSSSIGLDITRFDITRSVRISLIQEPMAPIVIALGRAVAHPNHTLIATIVATPISANNEPLIDGRICENPSDFLLFSYGRFGRPLTSIDLKGVEVIGHRVPPDFLPTPEDPAEKKKPTIIEAVRGTHLENVALIDAHPYLEQRGVSFNDDDFAVYDPIQSQLHVRTSSEESLELVEQLVGYYGRRHGHYSKMTRCDLTSQTRSPDKQHVLRKNHQYYSIPICNHPSRLRIFKDDKLIDFVEFDASQNHQGPTRFQLSAHFPLTSDRSSIFRIENAEFFLLQDKPLLFNTGIDSEDGSSFWLKLRARQFHAELPLPK